MAPAILASLAVSALPIHALCLNRPGDGLMVPDNSALELRGDLTIEAWIKPVSADTGGPFHFIVSKNYGGTGFALLLIGRGDNVRLQFEANDTVSYFVPMHVLRQSWWHVAGVRSGNELSLYVNGVQVGHTDAKRELMPNTLPLWIGTSPWDSFEGCLADVRIWNVARKPEDLIRYRDKALSASEPGLVAEWKFKTLRRGMAWDSTHHTKPGVVRGQARVQPFGWSSPLCGGL